MKLTSFSFVGKVDFLPVNETLTIDVSEEEMNCVDFVVLGDDQDETDEAYNITFIPEIPRDVFPLGRMVTITILNDGDSECNNIA